MDIYQTFAGQTLFFTGVTGFVGKVFLWKVLKEFGAMRKIYVLIRGKKGVDPQARLRKEVLSSPCFEPLKKELGEAEWTRRSSKVVALAGDILEEGLGLTKEDHARLTSEVNLIVHMAATVQFDERLDIAVKMNVLGALRVLGLAQKAPQLKAFVHMSTCYVNHSRHGPHAIRETLYPLPFEAEDMCKYILSQDVSMIPTVTNRLLAEYGFPNSYTFTKAMGEHLLLRRKGGVPLTIIRPAIVGCALKEPSPGWVDVLLAAGGVFLLGGLGVLREMYGKIQGSVDIIPVDYVVNTTIKLLHRTAEYYSTRKERRALRRLASAQPATAATASATDGAVSVSDGSSTADLEETTMATEASSEGPGLPFVYQSASSSSLNTLRWETSLAATTEYWTQHPHPRAVHPVDVTFVKSYPEYLLRIYTRRILPSKALKVMAALPVVGSPEKKKMAARLERAVNRGIQVQHYFAPFLSYEWFFSNTNSSRLDDYLQPEHRKNFACDLYEINWHAYVKAYSWGMVRYILKTDNGGSPPVMPTSGTELLHRASL